ncbi:MAG: hypothetical protein IJR87_01885 [Bacteroidaceae bacterium]|nr:hypothetical protein [Bacteroidaceae bacterium]
MRDKQNKSAYLFAYPNESKFGQRPKLRFYFRIVAITQGENIYYGVDFPFKGLKRMFKGLKHTFKGLKHTFKGLERKKDLRAGEISRSGETKKRLNAGNTSPRGKDTKTTA